MTATWGEQPGLVWRARRPAVHLVPAPPRLLLRPAVRPAVRPGPRSRPVAPVGATVPLRLTVRGRRLVMSTAVLLAAVAGASWAPQVHAHAATETTVSTPAGSAVTMGSRSPASGTATAGVAPGVPLGEIAPGPGRSATF